MNNDDSWSSSSTGSSSGDVDGSSSSLDEDERIVASQQSLYLFPTAGMAVDVVRRRMGGGESDRDSRNGSAAEASASGGNSTIRKQRSDDVYSTRHSTAVDTSPSSLWRQGQGQRTTQLKSAGALVLRRRSGDSATTSFVRRTIKTMQRTRCGTISTCLLMGSLCVWLVVVVLTSIPSSPTPTDFATSIVPSTLAGKANGDNWNTLRLTVYERSQLRRKERKRRGRRKSSQANERNRWKDWFWDALGYPTPALVPSRATIPPNQRTTRRGNSESLPKECQRPAWQEYNFPSCNDVHDIDLAAILARQKRASHNNHSETGNTVSSTNPSYFTGYVASGLWRSVWAVNARAVDTQQPAVLKMMRREHDVTPRNLDRHRRDAVVMERLSSSPYVVDMYAYCANSVVTEYLDTTLDDLIFDDVGTMLLAGGVSNGTSSADADAVVAVETNITATHRLQWALDVARGIQALHEMPGGSIVHADLQAKQFLVSPTTGIVKVNDFNRCRFMATNTSYHRASTAAAAELTTATAGESNASSLQLHSPHRYCSFRIPTAPGKMRSPEEYSFATLDEKIDIYATANILYSIFTKRDAWYESNERDAKFKIQDGVVPDMDIAWPDATLSTRTRLVQLTQRAYALDATQRISAKELVLELEALLDFHSRQHSVMRNSSADLVAPE